MVNNTNWIRDRRNEMYRQQAYNQGVQQQTRDRDKRLQRDFDLAQQKLQRSVTTFHPSRSSSSDVAMISFSVWLVAQCVVALVVLPIMFRTRSSSIAHIIAKSIAGCFSILSAIGCYCYDPIKASLRSATSLCSSSHKFSLEELGLAPITQKSQLEPIKNTTEHVVSKISDFPKNLHSKTVSDFPRTSTVEPDRVPRGFLERSNTEFLTYQAKPILMTLKFRGQFFNAEMTPTFDGKAIKTTDKMHEAERQKKVYTKMIEEIVKIHEPDYRESLGLIKGITNEGFIFENGILPHGNKTTDLWGKFLGKLEV